MSKIFISYRRSDAADEAGRLYDHLLLNDFSEEDIFKDVNSIPSGKNYQTLVQEAIQHSQIMLVIIGKTWLSCIDNAGNKRIEQEDDMVRYEVSTALKLPLVIIPVLVDEALMPTAKELPDILKPLATLQASKLRADPDFKNDMSNLLTSITQNLDEPWILKAKRNKRIRTLATISLCVLIAIAATIYFTNTHSSPVKKNDKLYEDVSQMPPLPVVNKIQSDLLGKELPQLWMFETLAEFHNWKFIDTAIDTKYLKYKVKAGLEDKGSYHDCELYIWYKADKQQWLYDTVMYKYFTTDYSFSTSGFNALNIPSNSDFTFKNNYKLAWKIGYSAEIFHTTPAKPIDLEPSSLYFIKSEESSDISIRIMFTNTIYPGNK